jgi:hypothetical protein
MRLARSADGLGRADEGMAVSIPRRLSFKRRLRLNVNCDNKMMVNEPTRQNRCACRPEVAGGFNVKKIGISEDELHRSVAKLFGCHAHAPKILANNESLTKYIP